LAHECIKILLIVKSGHLWSITVNEKKAGRIMQLLQPPKETASPEKQIMASERVNAIPQVKHSKKDESTKG
jgi:hypothetical protein